MKKRAIDDGGNENNAGKAWYVLNYTQQQLNRRHKALVSKNKPKEAEFWYMLQGKLYWSAEVLKKSQKYDKIAGLII